MDTPPVHLPATHPDCARKRAQSSAFLITLTG
jgi:hypothetical protein